MKTVCLRLGVVWVGCGLWLVSGFAAVTSNPFISAATSAYPSDQLNVAFHDSPTIVQTTGGLVMAWVGASRAGSPDASIYLSRNVAGNWTQPERVVATIHARTEIQMPCARPVLFKSSNGPLHLFYQSKDRRGRDRGYSARSEDDGKSWFSSRELGRSITGPARTKPIELAGGVLLCGSDTRKAGWRVHVEKATPYRTSLGWSRTRDLSSARVHNAGEPVLLNHGDGDIQALCRTRRGYIAEMWSEDSGDNWSPLVRTAMPNPDSGLDAVRLEDGRHVLVYQHSNRDRSVLNLAVTEDGKRWSAVASLEQVSGATVSDPSMILGADGKLHIVYAVDSERIKYLAIEPKHFVEVPMVGGNWPY